MYPFFMVINPTVVEIFKKKSQPHGGARGEVLGSSKSQQIICGQRMSVCATCFTNQDLLSEHHGYLPNFFKINQKCVEIFQSS